MCKPVVTHERAASVGCVCRRQVWSAPQIRVHDFRRYINLYVQDGPKNGATDSRQEFSDILTDLHFFTGKFLTKFTVKWLLNIPSHLAYVATLPCETLVLAKQAINDKLQGSVAT